MTDRLVAWLPGTSFFLIGEIRQKVRKSSDIGVFQSPGMRGKKII